jgi:S-layer homology domain
MKIEARLIRGLLACVLTIGGGGITSAESGKVPWPLASHRVEPKEFGTQDETITVVPATSFVGVRAIAPNLAVYCGGCTVQIEYWAPLDVPPGAVIDFIAVNNATDTDAIMGVALWRREMDANKTMLTGFSFPAHGWDTDIAGPLDILAYNHLGNELVLQVEQAANAQGNPEYFAWVEVHWHRTVSPPFGAPTFGDVPASDFGYPYVEALAASGITGGCGGGNFCPDANLTRRQMAIFLAKALGLHWPN